MQDNTTIARPYARAIFELAQADNNLQGWSDLLKLLSQVVVDPDMQEVISSPRVTSEQILEITSEVMGNRLDLLGRNFIKVLIDANRLRLVPYISDLFEKRRAEAEGRVDINVLTAYELEAQQSNQLSEVMGKRLGKKINISAMVDESLIGGIVIRAGDTVIDSSLRGRLNTLRNQLIG
ncbi:MAG: F0F1 ATP synthase subunit delta [Gammaproteobacteria bacterium]|nr:F0F1 ATP synthase subunit delta [Gammaproteobacteria bacterium]